MTTRKSAIAIENDAHCLTYDYCGGGLLWNCVDDDAYDDACDDAWQASGAFAREGAKQISTGKKVIVSEKSEDCVDAEHDSSTYACAADTLVVTSEGFDAFTDIKFGTNHWVWQPKLVCKKR